MAVKFSAFTTRTGTLDASTKIVGYDDPAGTKTNVEFSLATLAANSGIYAADGTIGTTRKALITDTIQFRDSGDTSDIFSLNTNGAFALGLGTTPGGVGAVIIGQDSVANQRGVSIGRSVTSGIEGICIGYEAGLNAATGRNINIGTYAQGSGTASIMLRTAAGFASTNTTPYSFSVYMTSTATPDFEVIGGAGAESTLNSSLKITGQGYTELNDIGTVATATWDIDWNNSNIQSITLNNGGAMTLNTPTNPKTGATYILKLIQGASPSTITWTASIFKWPAATAPVLSTSAGQVDIVTLIYDGTNYYGTSTINLS